MLVVEVDGDYHNEADQKIMDAQRTAILTQYGYRILRFTNEDVYNDIDTVIERIKESII